MKRLILISAFILSITGLSQVKNPDSLKSLVQKTNPSEIVFPAALYEFSLNNFPAQQIRDMTNRLQEDLIPVNPESAWKKGIHDALDSLSNNKLFLLNYGESNTVEISGIKGTWNTSSAKAFILLQKFGITYVQKYGCLVMPPQKAYIDAFNKTILNVLNQYYNLDILEYTDKNLSDYIITLGSEHDDWQVSK